jgi:hypothetical protein
MYLEKTRMTSKSYILNHAFKKLGLALTFQTHHLEIQ